MGKIGKPVPGGKVSKIDEADDIPGDSRNRVKGLVRRNPPFCMIPFTSGEAAMHQEPALTLKQRQFNAAMDRYEKKGGYRAIGKVVSLINISLQCHLLYLVLPHSIGPLRQLLSFCTAYLAADFINGLVHMYMDGNDRYDSPAGPLIAAFHLHHRNPRYQKSNILLVYFNESGSKIWLAGYLLLVAGLLRAVPVPLTLSYILTYFGILSSIAEVSHYCCHVEDSGIARSLRNLGLFLAKKHHGQHHAADNVNYAFLNGVTDPLLNIIARKYAHGYKNTTDRHYAAYTGKGTANRL